MRMLVSRLRRQGSCCCNQNVNETLIVSPDACSSIPLPAPNVAGSSQSPGEQHLHSLKMRRQLNAPWKQHWKSLSNSGHGDAGRAGGPCSSPACCFFWVRFRPSHGPGQNRTPLSMVLVPPHPAESPRHTMVLAAEVDRAPVSEGRLRPHQGRGQRG